jgi:hypothetical protein
MDTNKLAALKEQAEALAAYWKLVVDEFPPTHRQWFVWLTRYSPEIVEEAVAALALRLERGSLGRPGEFPEMSALDKLKYVSGCARNIAAGTKPPFRAVR